MILPSTFIILLKVSLMKPSIRFFEIQAVLLIIHVWCSKLFFVPIRSLPFQVKNWSSIIRSDRKYPKQAYKQLIDFILREQRYQKDFDILGERNSLFLNRLRCNVHVYERRLYEKRPIESWVQCTNRNERSVRTGLWHLSKSFRYTYTHSIFRWDRTTLFLNCQSILWQMHGMAVKWTMGISFPIANARCLFHIPYVWERTKEEI